MRGAVKRPLPAEALERAVGWCMFTHPLVRAHLISRDEDYTPEFAALRRPILVSYGERDEVVTPAMAKLIATTAPRGELSAYPGAGHATFSKTQRDSTQSSARSRGAC